MRTDLIKKFAEAGLKLKIEKDPIVGFRNNEQTRMMFQLDIQKGKDGKELFRIYPGAETNTIQVTATDDRLEQVVLAVKERAVEFETEIPYTTVYHQMKRHQEHGDKWIEQMAREHGRKPQDITKVMWPKGKNGTPRVFMKMKTTDGRRNFLAGMDERSLFICQLPRMATSVKAAHDMLKHPTVTMLEGTLPGKTIRQGEWFFANLTPTDEAAIEETLKKGVAIEKKCPIGVAVSDELVRQGGRARQRVGNPHIADEVLVVNREVKIGFRNGRRRDVYVRGAVRHVDHETVKFASWRRIFRNMEANQGSSMLGVNFVD